MKEGFHISINQFAEFTTATQKGKARILKQQLVPDKRLIPWYQLAKGSFKRYLADVKDHQPLVDGLKRVEEKNPENQRQISDKSVSLQALNKMMELHLEKHFKGLNYEAIKPNTKDIAIRDVTLGISPDLVFKAKIKGQAVYGGVKVHVSKNKPFSLNQCEFVSTVLMRYIKKNIVGPNDIVIPNLCLCIDIFGERIVQAKDDGGATIKEVQEICEEIKKIWPAS